MDGGIFKHEFVANLLPSRLLKIFFENRIIVSEVMAKSLVSCFFLTHGVYTGWPDKTSRTLRNYNGSYTLWGEISFGTFVDQYVLLLTYKFQ